MAKSLNKVMLIGNLTRDPELRYTPQGTAVCTFSIATNRSWKTESGEKDEVEFHRLVAWDKLAEICGKFLKKGTRAYVEGRLQTRKFTTKEDNVEKTITEIVISDMLMLSDRKNFGEDSSSEIAVPENLDINQDVVEEKPAASSAKAPKAKPEADEDIPF